jgi:hypothetical protein
MEIDLDKELRFHFESQVADKMRSGISENEARRLTRIEFGGMEQIKENCRERRGTMWLESIVQDIRFGLRQLRKSSGFTLAAVTTLALGIGATTAIFSVVDSLLLRPLPYPNATRIVRIWMTFAPRGMMEIPSSEPEFLEYRQSQSFAHVAGFSVGTLTLTGSGDGCCTAHDHIHTRNSWPSYRVPPCP